MNNIAIFVSGEGLAAQRIVRLFNEGNRVKTVLVVTDDSAAPLLHEISDPEVTLIHIPDNIWREKATEIASLIKEKDVKLIVLDGFAQVIPDELMEATGGEILRIDSVETAPKEVVAILEKDLRAPQAEVASETEEDQNHEEGNPSLESEWADALKIQYRPPKVPQTPPEIPSTPPYEPQFNDQQPIYKEQLSTKDEKLNTHHGPHHPMPSTFLIWSVLVTVFCCFIPGIIAIIFSSQVSSRYYAGDIEGAYRASRNAEIWIIVSFVLGILAATLYLPFMLIGW